jgi:hypothetical protein
MRTAIRNLGIAALLAALGLAAPAAAYKLDRSCGDLIKWKSSSVTMRMSSKSFPSGDPRRRPVIQGREAWNNGPVDFQMNFDWGDSFVFYPNFQNEVWFSSSDYWLHGAPALAKSWHVCGKIIEGDVVFDIDTDWNYGEAMRNNYAYDTSADRTLQTAAIHEFGHILGLGHEDAEYNIMGEDYTHVHTNNRQVNFYAGEDGTSGAIRLYGAVSDNKTDLGVVHWTRNGSYGDYSTHRQTTVNRTLEGESYGSYYDHTTKYWVYYVPAGTPIYLELTFENNGKSSRTPLVWYVISTDDNITAADTWLASRNPTLNRGKVYTTDQALTVPDRFTRGQVYYLGAVVDPLNAITEWDESNNATPVAVYLY